MDPTELTERYFVAVTQRDLAALMPLFAPDASILYPDGRVVTGVDALRQQFINVFQHAAPAPTPVAVIAGPRAIATEIEITLGDGSVRRTANFFHLNEAGLIQRISVYARSS
ncbi:MAG: nuclear transport factor 2 family protein [Polyangiales bacterium]